MLDIIFFLVAKTNYIGRLIPNVKETRGTFMIKVIEVTSVKLKFPELF